MKALATAGAVVSILALAGPSGCTCAERGESEVTGAPAQAGRAKAELSAPVVWDPDGPRPLFGQPLPPGTELPGRAELIRMAEALHMQDAVALGEHTRGEFHQQLLQSPELAAFKDTQIRAWRRIERWESVVRAVTAAAPPGFKVRDGTFPPDLAYGLHLTAPPAPDGPTERHLLVHVSYAVPYYFYYEQHARRIDGLIEREPIRYRVSPVFEPVLPVVERAIVAHYGYARMNPELASTQLPDRYVAGASEGRVATLFDALFTTGRW